MCRSNLYLRRTIVFAAVLIVNFLFPSQSKAGFSVTDWKYYKSIDQNALGEGKNYRVAADKEIYKGSHPGLNDLRVVIDDEFEVPYEIFIFREEKKSLNMVVEVLENYTGYKKENIVVVDLGEAVRENNKLTLEIADSNFGRRVMVEGSEDKLKWGLLAKDKYIYDFNFGSNASDEFGRIKWHRGIDYQYSAEFASDGSSRDTAVIYKKNKMRYLKITVFGAKDEEPLEISKVKIDSFDTIAAEETKYTCLIKEQKVNREQKSSEVVLDFEVENIPLSRLEIALSSKNYYRTVFVQGSNDLKEWKQVARDDIFDYSIENFEASKKTIVFAEPQFRYFKLVILNKDSLPVKVSSVTGFALDRSIVFPKEKAGELKIYYGNLQAEKPVYDYTRFVRKIDPRNLTVLPLGAQIDNPAYVFKKVHKPWTEERPYLLWLTLGVIVLVLVFLVAAMVKKVN
ncbi:MAG: DUF3999 family protein [Candidatus Omnitrophica bacterium]|nr:DUF3999 family protein [Candidatus Omnitrophota bacterium]